MKKLISLTLLFLIHSSFAYSASLDDIYRDLVKSDNQGYLPMFVKNRNAPDFLDEEKIPTIKEAETLKKDDTQPLSLINERVIKEEEKKKKQLQWEKTIEAVKTNNVTPVDLQEIEKKVAQNDPKAVEIYAYMFTRGVGVTQDLNKAFDIYQKAILLKVPNAEQNAITVYKSMKPEQKEKVKFLEVEEE